MTYEEVATLAAELAEQAQTLTTMAQQLSVRIATEDDEQADIFQLGQTDVKAGRTAPTLATTAQAAKVVASATLLEDSLVDLAMTQTQATNVALKDATGRALTTLIRRRRRLEQ